MTTKLNKTEIKFHYLSYYKTITVGNTSS